MIDKKIKFCITIVSTFDSRFRQNCLTEFVQNLKDLGANDVILEKLMKESSASWYNNNDQQENLIHVDIHKTKGISN